MTFLLLTHHLSLNLKWIFNTSPILACIEYIDDAGSSLGALSTLLLAW